MSTFYSYMCTYIKDGEQTCCSRCGFAETLEDAKKSLNWWLTIGDPYINMGIISELGFGDDWQLEDRGNAKRYYFKSDEKEMKGIPKPDWDRGLHFTIDLPDLAGVAQ